MRARCRLLPAGLGALLAGLGVIGCMPIHPAVERRESAEERSRLAQAQNALTRRQITLAERRIQRNDPALDDSIARLGLAAHAARREYGRHVDRADVATCTRVLSILHSRMEVHYAMAGALSDLGESRTSVVQADSARLDAVLVQALLDRLRELENANAARLRRDGRSRENPTPAAAGRAVSVGGCEVNLVMASDEVGD